MNKWIEALKIFNRNKNEWCVPKKGTEAYDEVSKLAKTEAEKYKASFGIELKKKKRAGVNIG